MRRIEIAIAVPGAPAALAGTLALPPEPAGLVVFAHGSGSGRLSPRNRFVADGLGDAGFATLLFDLLSEEEAADRANVFDIALLAERVGAAIAWARERPETAGLPIGLFGASTGAAAALVAAARQPEAVAAVVSRGGRPDLAGDALERVRAPVLLIVGGRDEEVIALNASANARLTCASRVVIVPGATHLFEERGALAQVVAEAAAWFAAHLRAEPATP